MSSLKSLFREDGPFGMGKEEDHQPTESESMLILKVAQKVISLRLTTAAVFMLEAHKPLTYISSQVMIFFKPIIDAIFGYADYDTFRSILEDRCKYEQLIKVIEDEENNYQLKIKQAKKEKKQKSIVKEKPPH